MMRVALVAGMLARACSLRAPAPIRRRRAICMSAPANGAFETLWGGSLAHGECVTVAVPDPACRSRVDECVVEPVEPVELERDAALPLDELHPLELDRMTSMHPERKALFAGGRVAMRRALRAPVPVGQRLFWLLRSEVQDRAVRQRYGCCSQRPSANGPLLTALC